MKFVLLGAGCLALFAAAGCGSSSSRDEASDGSAPTTSVKTPSNTVDPSRAEVNTRWMMLYSDSGTNSEPPQTLYGVFGRKQTDDEAKIAPELVADSSCSMRLPEGSKHTDFGKPIEEQARILLRGVGPGYDLAAVPTTADGVSVALFPTGGGTCTRPGDSGLIVAADVYGDTATIYGMVDDGVRSVDIIADGQTHRAKLGENGFSVALPSGAETNLQKLVLHKADGSKAVFPLG